MSDEDLTEFVDEDEEQESPEELQKARQLLEERCDKAGIEFEVREFGEGEDYVRVEMPNGREKRTIRLFRLEQLNKLLSIPFEKYVFLGDLAAICSYEDGSIEAALRSVAPMGSSMIRRRLSGRAYDEEEQETEDDVLLELRSDNTDSIVTITISNTSESIQTLLPGPFLRPGRLSLKISGLKINQHNRALSLLQRYSDSLFFQIDMAIGVPLSLIRERRPVRGARRVRSRDDIIAIQYPKTEYDEAPMSLFWYAQSAIGMPLLRFLAYYQVIEFYFFSYSQEEAMRKIRNILKDPTFRTDRDTDIARLLAAVSVKGRGYGDERSQLRATLQACIDPSSLREFLTENDARKEFFSNKQKGLANHKVPINNPEADLRNDVADLIYEIRCRIVHTKGDNQEGEINLLLPFSKEAELLYHDIELMQYVARQVLINASSPIHI